MKNSIHKAILLVIIQGLFNLGNSPVIYGQTKTSYSDNYTISGQWVNLKYTHALMLTKSARAAQESCEIPYITIDKKLNISVVFRFHEGLKSKLFPNEKNNYITEYDYLKLKQISPDKVIIFNSESIDTLILTSTIIEKNQNSIINKLIFDGNYVDLKTGEKVTFTTDGQVLGLGNFKKFIVASDYYDVGLNYDLFKLYNKNQPIEGAWILHQDSILTWKFVSDTLKIYNLTCAEYFENTQNCVELGLGKLLYDLKKIK